MPATPKLNITRSISQGDLNPVGMIVQSMLTEAQFQALNGTSWVLMDGRSVAGSSYATVTGSATIPDARGMVLRGRNDGGSALGTRADGKQNPDGNLTLGSDQAHATAKNGLSATAAASSVSGSVGGSDGTHTHGFANALRIASDENFAGGGNGGEGANAGTLSATNSTGSGHGHGFNLTAAGQAITINDGDNETRMRNITVNHFIKIN